MPRVAIQDMVSSMSGTFSCSIASNASTLLIGDATHTVYSWGFIFRVTNRTTPFPCVIFQKSSTKYPVQFRIESTGALRAAVYDGTNTAIALGTTSIIDNNWHTAVGVRGADNTLKLYVDGVLIQSVSSAAIGNTSEASNFQVGGNGFNGNILNAFFTFNAMTAQDVLAYHKSNTLAYSNLINWPLDEGVGTIAYDSSGNGNNGTITAGKWVRDTPTKKRKTVNDNLVYNGGFELPNQHSFDDLARTTDGNIGSIHTATAPLPYVFGSGGTWSAELDTAEKYSGFRSLKLSTTSVGATCTGLWGDTVYTLMPILPNTTYTLTAKVKTNNVATNGAYLIISQFTMAKVSAGAGAATNKLSGTNDWTTVTASITTSATAGRIYIYCYNGVAGNISDAWFDNIELRPTTPETRTAISGPYRQPVNNMVRNGDFEYAPPSIVPCTGSEWLDGTTLGSSTNNVFGWRIFNYTNQRHAYFDSTEKHSGKYSLKLSTLGVNSSVGVCNNGSGYSFTNIPCLPNTNYTATFWMKTNYVSGSATSGAFMRLVGGNVTDSQKIKTTTDWTKYSINVTTTGTASRIDLEARVLGSDGAATLIMDAWFDDIQLTPTTPTTRSIAT
jgi:hypothetical protein